MNKTAFPNQRLWPDVKCLQPSQLRAAEEATSTRGDSLQGNLEGGSRVHLLGVPICMDNSSSELSLYHAKAPRPMCASNVEHHTIPAGLRIYRGSRALAEHSLQVLSLQTMPMFISISLQPAFSLPLFTGLQVAVQPRVYCWH